MKKVLFIFLAAAACTFTSCERKQCWRCRYAFTGSYMRNDMECDKTKSQIREYEKRYKKANPTMLQVSCVPN